MKSNLCIGLQTVPGLPKQGMGEGRGDWGKKRGREGSVFRECIVMHCKSPNQVSKGATLHQRQSNNKGQKAVQAAQN